MQIGPRLAQSKSSNRTHAILRLSFVVWRSRARAYIILKQMATPSHFIHNNTFVSIRLVRLDRSIGMEWN